jgi:hypothetical protein
MCVHPDVICVSSGCCICCNDCTCMLHAYVSSVLDVCCKCFIWMLHMFQWLYTYIASVYSKCFICFSRMMQLFYLDVANVAVAIHICCKRMLQIFSHVLDVCCRSASCCNISRRRKRTQRSPHERQAKRAWVVPIYMRISRHETSISRHETHNCMRRRPSMQGQIFACRLIFF